MSCFFMCSTVLEKIKTKISEKKEKGEEEELHFIDGKSYSSPNGAYMYSASFVYICPNPSSFTSVFK